MEGDNKVPQLERRRAATRRRQPYNSGTDSHADGEVAGSATRQRAASWWRKAGFKHPVSGERGT